MQTGIKKKKYAGSFFFSVLLHVFVLAALLAGFDFHTPPLVVQNNEQANQTIQATVVNVLPPAPAKPAPAPSVPKPAKPVVHETPAPPPIMAKPKPVPPPPKPVAKIETPKPAIAIAEKKPVVKPKPKLQPKKMEADKIEQQLLADIRQQTLQRKKIKQQKRQKAIAAEFAKEMKQLNAKSLEQQMHQQIQQAQQQIASAAHVQQTRGEVNKYKALILQIISQNWLVPPTVDKSLRAELLIRVAPGGVVLDVQVIKSSGDVSLDHSARAAVFKSSPLPVPADADAFDEFRQFVLRVKPEHVLFG